MIMQMLLSCLCADGQNSVSEIAVFSSQILKKCGCAFTQKLYGNGSFIVAMNCCYPKANQFIYFFIVPT